MTAVLLLAAFLAVVLVGGALVALYDVVEGAWNGARAPHAARPVRGRVASAAPLRAHPPTRTPTRPRAAGSAGAWRHLH